MGSIYENHFLCPKCWETDRSGRQKKKTWPRYNEIGKCIDYGEPPKCPNCGAYLWGHRKTKALDYEYNKDGVQITVFSGTKL